MQPPTHFVNMLREEFPSLRIRWSEKRECWQIEQQIGRGSLPPIHINPYDDDLIRAKDGFWKVCEVRPGTRMPCPDCDRILEVHSLKFKEVKCPNCVKCGRDGCHLAGYFPLNETLIEHLRFLNPLTGGIARNAQMVDDHNKRLLDMRAREVSNTIDATRDDYTFIAGIQKVGYTGTTKIIHRSKF